MNSHLRASIAGLVYQSALAITAFVLTPALLTGLGTQLFGAWVLLNTVRAYASLSDFGIPGTIVMFAGSSQDRANSERVITAGILVSLVTTTVAVALLLVLKAPILDAFFKIPVVLLPAIQKAYTLMLLTSIPLVVARTLAAALGALQRFDIQMAVDSGMVIASGLFSLWVIKHGGGIVGIALVALLISGLQAGAMAIALLRIDRGFRPRLGLTRQWFLRLARYSLRGQWADLGLTLSDPLLKSLVATGSGATAVGKLQVGSTVAMMPNSVVYSMSSNLFPAIADRHTAGDPGAISELVRRYLLFIACLIMPMSLLLIVAAPAVISWWLDTTDSIMVLTTRMLVVAFGVRAVALLVPWRVLSGMERPQDCSLAMLVHILCLGLGGGALLALSAYSYVRILGVFLLSYIGASAFLWWRMKISLPAFIPKEGRVLLSSLFRVTVVSLVASVVGWYAIGLLPGGLPDLVASGVLLLISYLLIVIFLPSSERLALFDLSSQLLRSAKQAWGRSSMITISRSE